MNDPVDWSVTSWDGNRRQQHREYLALSFREKLEILEQMAEWVRLPRLASTVEGEKAVRMPPKR
jgi:hypothetical protein